MEIKDINWYKTMAKDIPCELDILRKEIIDIAQTHPLTGTIHRAFMVIDLAKKFV